MAWISYALTTTVPPWNRFQALLGKEIENNLSGLVRTTEKPGKLTLRDQKCDPISKPDGWFSFSIDSEVGEGEGLQTTRFEAAA